MNDFSTWNHANLVAFAQQSYTEILELRSDLKAAITAYRQLNIKESKHETDTFNSLTD